MVGDRGTLRSPHAAPGHSHLLKRMVGDRSVEARPARSLAILNNALGHTFGDADHLRFVCFVH
jgi:hypothetical protein